jgi:L-cysteine S-thiosulfotransferase
MRILLAIAVAIGTAIGTGPVFADTYNDLLKPGQTPEQHREMYRAYFKKKFPGVKFDDFSNGLYALPQFAAYRATWEEDMDFPPYEVGLERGKALWEKPFKNGKTFSGCFANDGRNIAQKYPYWDEAGQKIRTAEMDLIDCAKKNGEELPFVTADLDKDQKARVQLAELTAHFYALARGQKIDIDLSRPGAKAAFDKGKEIFWSRRGQLNFACYQCHVDLAGNNLGGGQPLSAGLGHTTAWPAQRIEWARIDTIHQRYATCFSQVRAKPYKHLGEEFNALELYEKYMSGGLPLTAPSMRN